LCSATLNFSENCPVYLLKSPRVLALVPANAQPPTPASRLPTPVCSEITAVSENRDPGHDSDFFIL
jgi:hypothetical protein